GADAGAPAARPRPIEDERRHRGARRLSCRRLHERPWGPGAKGPRSAVAEPPARLGPHWPPKARTPTAAKRVPRRPMRTGAPALRRAARARFAGSGCCALGHVRPGSAQLRRDRRARRYLQPPRRRQAMGNLVWSVGDVRITRIVERETPVVLGEMMGEATPEA